MCAAPQKNYEAAFGALQSQYGLGGFPTPTLPQKDAKPRKWYKWGNSCSSSVASLIRPATRSEATPPPPPSPSSHAEPTQGTLSESELRLGKLTAEYGFGAVSQIHFNHK